MNNLPEDYLYRRIPDGIITEDARQLLRAVVGGFQDSIAEMRTLAAQIQLLWVPDNAVGEPFPVIIVTYNDEFDVTQQATLNVTDATPAATLVQTDVYDWCYEQLGLTAVSQVTYVKTSPLTDTQLYVWYVTNDGEYKEKQAILKTASTPTIPVGAELLDWCAAEAGILSSQILSLQRTTDVARTAESRTLLLLAETLGAKLYDDLSSGEDAKIANQKRALKTYFSRLKVKGTALSFELLGRLHGFNNVRFAPLWGRVSPRLPNNIGARDNDEDFSQQPQGLPTPGQPTELYNPEILNDGDVYTWKSAPLGIDENQTDFILTGINGFNPYIKIQALATPIQLPNAGTYFLKGGAYGSPARSIILPAAAGQLSNLRFEAIADGSSFNSVQIVVEQLFTSGVAKVQLTVYHNLSSIKFRTSYFNLTATADYATYTKNNTLLAQPSEDLARNPTLWQPIALKFPGTFTNNGVALDPYRRWAGGSAPMPIVETWPDLTITPPVGGAIVPRTQADINLQTINTVPLGDGMKRLQSNLDDVRPATRYPRSVNIGLSLLTEIQYAPHISQKQLRQISATTTTTGSAGTEGIDYPTKPFTGSFLVSVTVTEQIYESGTWNDISTTITDYAITSETNPANLDEVAFFFNHPTAGILNLSGTFNFSTAQYTLSVTQCGTENPTRRWIVSGILYGFWEAIGTERLQNEPPLPSGRHYQPRPEDETEFTYKYQFYDAYPWRRELVAGGELVASGNELSERAGCARYAIALTAHVIDENGQQLAPFGVDSGLGDTGYVILRPVDNASFGQQAVAFLPPTSLPENGQTLHHGPLSTVLLSQLGTPYAVGAVRGILVADPGAHWTAAQRVGLVGWFHCGEHPKQPYILADKTEFNLNQHEFESGAFTSNYLLRDRVWDNHRGWMLALHGRTSSTPAGYFKIAKSRVIGLNWTISFWLKAARLLVSSAEYQIIAFGPITVMLGGYASYIQFYVKNSEGTNVAIGGQQSVVADVPSFYSLSSAEIGAQTGVPVDVCSIVNVPQLSGLNPVNDVELAPGMTVLLVGQTDAKTNGCYSVAENTWYRLTTLEAFNEVGAYYTVQQGSNAATYQCANVTSPILYGTDAITYTKYNCTLYITPDHTAIPALAQPFGAEDLELLVSAPDYDNSATPIISDLRIWSVPKTESETNAIKLPPFKPTASAIRPTFFTGTSGFNRALQVTESGYVFPNVKPIDYYLDCLTRVIRYNGMGEYVGPSHRLQVGLGDEKPLHSPLTLGWLGCKMQSHGTHIAASTSSELPGFNQVWQDDSGSSSYRRVPYSQRLTPNSDASFLVADPTSSYHPTELDGQNPGQARIYVKGENEYIYEILAKVRKSESGDVPELYAKLAAQNDLSGIDPITPLDVLANGEFYGVAESAEIERQPQPEFVSDAMTSLETAGSWNGRLAVQIIAGEPVVNQLTGAVKNTPPIFLYTHVKNYLDYALASALYAPSNTPTTPWSLPSDYGKQIGVPCRSIAGNISLAGTPVTLAIGKYRVVLDVSNLGELDPDFYGYDTEISLTAFGPDGEAAASPTTVKTTLLQNGNSKFRVKYAAGDTEIIAKPRYANCTPGSPGQTDNPNYDTVENALPNFSTTLQAALDELADLTGGIEVLNDPSYYPSVIGGPYWVKFTQYGAKNLLQIETTKGFTAAITRYAAGSSSEYEIQKIVFNRPLSVVEIDVKVPILYAAGVNSWALSVYLTNPLTTLTTVRRLAIHHAWVYRVVSQLYKVQPAQSGTITPELVTISGSDTPASKPGGFRTKANNVGVASYAHEKDIYATSAELGDIAINTDLPAAHLLTGSTHDRTSSLTTTPETEAQQANFSAPTAPSSMDVKLWMDGAAAPDPDAPALTELVSVSSS